MLVNRSSECSRSRKFAVKTFADCPTNKSNSTPAYFRYWYSLRAGGRSYHVGISLESAIFLGKIFSGEIVRGKTCNECFTVSLSLKPETANQLKFNFFPDIWADYQKDFLFDLKWQKFPNGRRRRELLRDPLTGQSYESYDVNATEIGNTPLRSDILHEGGNEGAKSDDDDEFDDQFEEDIQDKKLFDEYLQQQQQQETDNSFDKSDDFDLSSSRWVAYDALSSALER